MMIVVMRTDSSGYIQMTSDITADVTSAQMTSNIAPAQVTSDVNASQVASNITTA